ncbi:unnamed protein product [Hymenolepis diminuta]|uniref:KH_dom_type_1 domain-containing protein n=1 Tax=Hymenolepis diminuta TaxID=6216 RepID=A0A0R3SN62_HYMDI|nr:unnamed protein product [Hymenolepis diminuta]VUZ43899.1 unnamed protein product [Hymenolepis diminuta]
MPKKAPKSSETGKAEKEPPTCSLRCWAPKKGSVSSYSYDPNEFRDIDNASPETQELCRRFPCHFCVFVYIPSNEVDDELYPFFRNECKEMVLTAKMDEKIRKRLMQTAEVNGSSGDKRLKAIEAQTGCSVRLGKLHGIHSVIKGLPRRRLTITGPSFVHISRALILMEEYFPRLMRYTYYPNRLPQEGDKLKNGGIQTIDYHSLTATPRIQGTMSLTQHIDDHSNWRKYFHPK